MARFTIEQLNAARDAHRHRGTTGGKGNARALSRAELAHHAERQDAFQAIRLSLRNGFAEIKAAYQFDIHQDDWSALCPF